MRQWPAAWLIGLVAVMSGAAGCGGPSGEPPVPPEEVWESEATTAARAEQLPAPSSTLAFGFVNVTNSFLKEVIFFRDGWVREDAIPKPVRVPLGRTGEFIVQDLPPGRYYLAAYLGPEGWVDAVYEDQEEYVKVLREVVVGELSYLGSYRLVPTRRAGPKDLLLHRLPRERVLLERLAFRLQGTPWAQRAADQLAVLTE